MSLLNFLQISLTTRCNLQCVFCPIKDYRNTDNIAYRLTNERLIPWLEKNIDPKRWIIELTGGEPALYNGIAELCNWLSINNYHTLIKTNGLIEIKPYKNIIRVAAFHIYKNPPKFWDRILIVNQLQSDIKEEYCKQNDMPYDIIGLDKDTSYNFVKHEFDKIAFLDPHGHNVRCPAKPISWKADNDPYTIEHMPLKYGKCCKYCKAAIDAWRFMPEEWKQQ